MGETRPLQEMLAEYNARKAAKEAEDRYFEHAVQIVEEVMTSVKPASEERQPALGPFEAEVQFACGCKSRHDCRRPWAAEEWNLETCKVHRKPRIARYGASPSTVNKEDVE